MKKILTKVNLERFNKVKTILLAYDLIAVNLAYFLALYLRFDCSFMEIPRMYLDTYMRIIPLYSLISLIVFWCLKIYRGILRYASYDELVRVIFANTITALFHFIIVKFMAARMPTSYYIFGMMFQMVFLVAVRFSYRFLLLLGERLIMNRRDNLVNSLLIGGGETGRIIIRDAMASKNSDIKFCCIIDDNPDKWGSSIDGIEVVGGREKILESVERYQIKRIFIAIPSADAIDRRDIVNICNETECELKILPGVYQLASGEVSIKRMKDVAVEDLLGREQVKLDMKEIDETITGKTVMVTGGGGSIGSELCRQIASRNPKKLIIFDVYENNAYAIEQELKAKYGDSLDLLVLIGSVRDSRRIYKVFADYKPEVVYHAAAHKHVPLMETSPCEAIKNNAVGTYKTAYAALQNGCEKFVLISTDKAVNPTNIMGASKRICEMIIQCMSEMIKNNCVSELPRLFDHIDDGIYFEPLADYREYKTKFVAVRFGNVLGSNGSVIPLFKKQIAGGGPVTVTHPDIIRYFMTIPEAVSLVLQASTYAAGGEIFVLDMGEPVKIADLAKNLIRLSGFVPDVDIKIEYSGLRPGEKLYEEKLMEEEGMRRTANDLIHIGSPIAFDIDLFLKQLQSLTREAYRNDEQVRDMVREIVPQYTYSR